jgi:hypothetical protein
MVKKEPVEFLHFSPERNINGVLEAHHSSMEFLGGPIVHHPSFHLAHQFRLNPQRPLHEIAVEFHSQFRQEIQAGYLEFTII